MQNSANRRCCNLARIMSRIMEFKLFFLVIAFLQVLLHCTRAATCVKQNSCSCKFDDGSGVISLSTLASTDPDIPRFNFTKAPDPSHYSFAYNPCNNFTWFQTPCQKVAACQSGPNGKNVFDIGDQDTATFDEAGTTITYKAGAKSTIVKLQCDLTATDPVFEAVGEDPTDYYTLNLRSNCACKNGCLGGGGGLSVGSALCIIFSVLLILYVVLGVLFLKFVRGAEGKELIPNYEFWKELPLLIKDGVLFLASLCKSDSNYEQI